MFADIAADYIQPREVRGVDITTASMREYTRVRRLIETCSATWNIGFGTLVAV
jgi:hypothetical protein